MIYMKALFLGVFFFVGHLLAAESIVLDVKQLENRVYSTSTIMQNSNVVNIEAPEETLAQLKKSGVKLPITVDQKQTIVKTIATSAKNNKGVMPFTGSLASNIKAKSSTQSGTQNVERSYTVSGSFRGNTVTIDTVSGDSVKPELEAAMKQALAKMMQSAEYPKKSMKVGDSFSDSVPISLPVQGAQPVNMVLTTQYTLQRIENKRAHFELTQKYVLADSKENPMQITVSGSGKGAMTYDGALYQVTSLMTDSTMHLNAVNGPMKSIIKVHATTKVTTSVSRKK
jgi:hypothetical protein